MVSTREPQHMTDDDRRREIASLIARAVLRSRRMLRLGLSNEDGEPCKQIEESRPDRLDHVSKRSPSVANGSAGYGAAENERPQ